MFSDSDLTDVDHPHNDPLLVKLQIGTCKVTRVLVDTGSSVDLIFRQTLIKMMVDLKDSKPSSRALTGFNISSTQMLGTIRLNVFCRRSHSIDAPPVRQISYLRMNCLRAQRESAPREKHAGLRLQNQQVTFLVKP
ncbi:hypothetical protein N665_0704s0003 [Sinapis alba]|nr:hypothetical protein N665_0704s0003 [Sinapis alba]